MKRYCYIKQRTSRTFMLREIIALEKQLVIGDKKVDRVNKFAIRIENEVEETITYLKEVEGKNLRDLKKELEKLVQKKGLSCRYEWEGKTYLIVTKNKREGAWHDNDLIIHQIKPSMMPQRTEVICLGKSEPVETEIPSHEFITYYKDWKRSLIKLLNYNYNYLIALKISFILTFNKYLSKNISIEKAVKLGIKHSAINRKGEIVNLGITKVISKEQFCYWIEPTYYGKITMLSPNLDFYSSLESKKIERAFRYFIGDFVSYLED